MTDAAKCRQCDGTTTIPNSYVDGFCGSCVEYAEIDGVTLPAPDWDYRTSERHFGCWTCGRNIGEVAYQRYGKCGDCQDAESDAASEEFVGDLETGEAGWICSKHGRPVGDVGCLVCVNEAEAGAASVADGMLAGLPVQHADLRFDDEVCELLAQARGLLNRAWLANMQAADYQWEQELGHDINDVYNAVSGLIEQRIYGRKAL